MLQKNIGSAVAHTDSCGWAKTAKDVIQNGDAFYDVITDVKRDSK